MEEGGVLAVVRRLSTETARDALRRCTVAWREEARRISRARVDAESEQRARLRCRGAAAAVAAWPWQLLVSTPSVAESFFRWRLASMPVQGPSAQGELDILVGLLEQATVTCK